jgi:hypothetical protein
MPVLIFERQGGIAGFQDKLVVGYGGEYYLSRGATGDRIGMLPSDRRMELQGWLDRLAPFTWKSEDNPGGPDSMVQVLVWAGLGTANADDAQQQELLDWAANLLQELSAAGS